MILSGKIVAEEVYKELEKQIASLPTPPTLGAVLVGNSEASKRYIRQKQKFAQKVGMNFKLFSFEDDISEASLLKVINELNNDADIHGYIVQLPLPKHIDDGKIIAAINPLKDVDGFHPVNQGKTLLWDPNAFIPCTPAGVMKIFEHYDISLQGKHVCILWRSNIVGKPLANLCINAWATLTSCNSHTPDVTKITQEADIVICATGASHILQADMVKADAVVIDVGFSVIDGKILGDADFEALEAQWNTITPVPGWVGPMTVALLLSNTLRAYELSQKK